VVSVPVSLVRRWSIVNLRVWFDFQTASRVALEFMNETEKLKETLHGMLERYKGDVKLLKNPTLITHATAQALPFSFIKQVSAATDKLEKA
jgi:hypothetical protein